MKIKLKKKFHHVFKAFIHDPAIVCHCLLCQTIHLSIRVETWSRPNQLFKTCEPPKVTINNCNILIRIVELTNRNKQQNRFLLVTHAESFNFIEKLKISTGLCGYLSREICTRRQFHRNYSVTSVFETNIKKGDFFQMCLHLKCFSIISCVSFIKITKHYRKYLNLNQFNEWTVDRASIHMQ